MTYPLGSVSPGRDRPSPLDRRSRGSGRPSARLRRSLAASVLAALCLAGCRDAERHPLAVLVAAETRGALALRAELPALPDLAARAGLEDRLAGAIGLWETSWEVEPAEAGELRAEAYRQAAPGLAERLGADEVRGLLGDMGLALRAVGTLDQDALEPDLRAEVARARGLHRRAERYLSDGFVAGAWELEMEVSDALRAFAPPVVAQSLLANAEEALATRGDSLEGADRDRAHRLVDGARRAVEAADWSRAIRRAFYASQILGLPGR